MIVLVVVIKVACCGLLWLDVDCGMCVCVCGEIRYRGGVAKININILVCLVTFLDGVK